MDGYTCGVCGDPIDPSKGPPTVDQAVWGWEHKTGTRQSGKQGGSDILNRRRLQRWAHHSCVLIEKSGNAIDQTTLTV